MSTRFKCEKLCNRYCVIDKTPENKKETHYFPNRRRFKWFPDIILDLPIDSVEDEGNRPWLKLARNVVKLLNSKRLTVENVSEFVQSYIKENRL